MTRYVKGLQTYRAGIDALILCKVLQKFCSFVIKTKSSIFGASLIKSCFNDAYYVREDGGNLWFLGSFETAQEANEAFGRWAKCH